MVWDHTALKGAMWPLPTLGHSRQAALYEHLLYSRHEIIVIRQAVLYEHFGTFATE